MVGALAGANRCQSPGHHSAARSISAGMVSEQNEDPTEPTLGPFATADANVPRRPMLAVMCRQVE